MAIKLNPEHKGMTTRAAHKAGEGVQEYAQEHYHDPGAAGKRARFAVIAKGWHHGGSKRSFKGKRK